MDVVDYSSNLPNVREGFTIRISPDIAQSNFYSGNIRGYRKYSEIRATVEVSWFLNQEQYYSFNEFYITSLDNGQKAFRINLFFPEMLVVKFASNFTIPQMHTGQFYEVEANLLILSGV